MSAPAPPETLSLPIIPYSRSAPAFPVRVSCPAPPWTASIWLPPVYVSFPVPRKARTFLPAAAVSMVSASVPPVRKMSLTGIGLKLTCVPLKSMAAVLAKNLMLLAANGLPATYRVPSGVWVTPSRMPKLSNFASSRRLCWGSATTRL